MTMTLSERAADELATIVQEQASADQGVRVLHQGGGCACGAGGFAMGLDTASADDSVLEVSGVRFILDHASAEILEGASIDYVEDAMTKGFKIEAPNGGGGACGCGGH